MFTDGPPPPEWIEYLLVERFHWPLATARATPLGDGLALLMMHAEENKWRNAQAKTK